MIESVGIFLVIFLSWTLGGFLLERYAPAFLKWLEKVVTR